MVMYRTSQDQMNDALAFGMSLMFMMVMFGLVKSLVFAALKPEKESPKLLPQTKVVSSKRGIPEGTPGRLSTSERLPQVLIEGGEPVPSQYRYLVGWVRKPLPEYSLAVELLPAAEIVTGERKIDAVLKQLKDGVESIQQSDRFRLFLSTMAKFHDYSIGNLILITIQKPDATHVAGFNTWRELGRWVKKGAKGISILAPVLPPRPTCPECGAKVPKGARFCPECGKEVEVEEGMEATPRFFRVVYVFENT